MYKEVIIHDYGYKDGVSILSHEGRGKNHKNRRLFD